MNRILAVAAFSFVAGYVDTVGFVALFGLFTAHVTGNFVLVGASIAGSTAGFVAKLLALPVFFTAVALVTLIVRTEQKKGVVNTTAITIIQVVSLAMFMIAGGLTSPFHDADAWPTIGVGMLGVATMAIQNATSRLLSPAGTPPTTIMTGNTTQAAIDCVDILLGIAKTDTKTRLKSLVSATSSFAFGAILGAVAYLFIGFWGLALPITALISLHAAEPKGRVP